MGYGGAEMTRRVDIAGGAVPDGGRLHTPSARLGALGTDRRTSPAVPPALATKFRPPRRQAQVLRSRLIDALRVSGMRRLTVIHAPSGYGKTTLAAQWAEEISGDGVNVAWLNIDDNDNNLVWFLTGLLEAIRRVNPAVVGDLGAILEQSDENAERLVLTSLINHIAEDDECTAVIIDDWHRVTSAPVVDALGFLLECGCENLKFVISTRSQSRLPLSRMRIHDELTEINADSLCFDEIEAQSFLTDVAGLELHAVDMTNLRNSTSGWPAGLQLASLSLRSGDSTVEVISHISGGHHAIADFLTENVLAALEPQMLHFLLVTSIVDRICGSLASALSGESHGQAMLEEVEARDLFLRRSDESRDWFHYHHLFAEFLRRRLDRDHPELPSVLHRKASDWFADRHMLVEAVDHALGAGDTHRAVELVEADGLKLLEYSQMATLFGLVDKLPAAVVVSDAKLQLDVACANDFLNRSKPAYAALRRVDAALAKMPASGGDVADLRAMARVVEADLRATVDRIDGLEDLVSECLSRPNAFPPFLVSLAANMMTHSALYRFDFAEVHRWQEWAAPYHAQQSGPYVPALGCAREGLAAFEQLDLERAQEYFRKAWRAAQQAGAVESQVARLLGAPLAELLYERGEIAEAQQLLDESLKLGAEEGMVDWIRSRFVMGARMAVLRGERAAAAKLLDEGADTAERLSTARLKASVENERVLLGLPTRRAVSVSVQFAQRQRPVDGIAEITAQLMEDTAIHLLIADSPTTERVDLACRWAREWVDRLQGRGRDRALLRAQRTLVACLSAVGQTTDAKQLFGSILSRCAGLGLIRFPLDGGQRLVSMIAEIHHDLRTASTAPTRPQPPTYFLGQLLAAADIRDTTEDGTKAGKQNALQESPGVDFKLAGCPRMTVLRSDLPRWTVRDEHGHLQSRSLSGRHAELLVLLSQQPEGLTADHLAILLHEEYLDAVTVRAEMSRLRKAIGCDLIGSRPYRLLKPITSDLADVLAALDADDVDAALSHYCGPLLPRSEAPAIASLRIQLSTSVRAAVISRGDLAALRRWLDSPEGRDDRDGWRILHESGDVPPAVRAKAAGHIARIDHEFG